MNNEGWIYIVESKLNSKKIKIGSTSNQTPKQRLKNYATYGGIKIIFACKYNDFSNIETALHIYFGDFFDTNVDGNEWFDFSKKSNQEFIYRISPFLLTSSIDVYKDTFFDYSNEFWEKFDNWLKEHSNDNCKKYNSFLKNKNYTDYREFVLSKSTSEKNNKKIEKPELTKQLIPQNKICKYETYCKNGRIINWNLFFDDHKELVGKKVCFKNGKKDKMVEKYFAKLIKLKTGDYGVFFKNEEMSFTEYCTQLYLVSHPNFNHSVQGTAYAYFVDTGKSIRETYEELKWK